MTSVTETLPRVLQTEEIRYLWCIAPAISLLHRFERYSALLWSYERHGVELRESALSVVVSTHVSDQTSFLEFTLTVNVYAILPQLQSPIWLPLPLRNNDNANVNKKK